MTGGTTGHRNSASRARNALELDVRRLLARLCRALGSILIQMTSTEARAAKMRQMIDAAGLVPSEGAFALARLVVSTRPWRDENLVASALRDHAGRYWPDGVLDKGLADGAGLVAEQMRAISLAGQVSDENMMGIMFGMLHNVARGRQAAAYDLLGDVVRGVPKRTIRRYKQRVREAGGNPGLEALGAFLKSLQFDLDVAELVRRGRTPAAARRWLERHPTKHASDAPPPRAANAGTRRTSRTLTKPI